MTLPVQLCIHSTNHVSKKKKNRNAEVHWPLCELKIESFISLSGHSTIQTHHCMHQLRNSLHSLRGSCPGFLLWARLIMSLPIKDWTQFPMLFHSLEIRVWDWMCYTFNLEVFLATTCAPWKEKLLFSLYELLHYRSQIKISTSQGL